MRQGLIWIVLLVAVAGLAWLLFGGGGTSGGGADVTDPGAGERADLLDDEGPTLTTRGSAQDGGAARMPNDLRGHGTIQGTVLRDGVPTAASVELRHVATLDPDDPFKGGFETLMIARMLDAGVSRTAVIARDDAGDDGQFVFRGLAPGTYEVRGTTEAGVMGFAPVTVPAYGARVAVTIEIPTGDLALVGRITYADGRPFQGLAVATRFSPNDFSLFFGAGKMAPASTDAEGRFRIAGLAKGSYQLSAVLPGTLRVMGAPIELPYEGEYLLTIQSGGAEVRGTVLRASDEQPIAGATIYGGGGDPSSMFAIFSVRSAADGTFSLTLPTGRGGGMFVKADGFAPQMVDFDGGASRDVIVTMLALARLSGRVTAKSGAAPVAGVTVFATASGGRGMGSAPVTARTGADGRYAIEGVAPGAVRVHALGAGWASAGLSGPPFGETITPYAIELEPGQEGTLDLEVVAGGRVRGRVLDETGRPVPGAVVQASAGLGSPQSMAMFMGAGATFGAVVTDADGAYEIDVLVPGTQYTVVARAPGHSEVTSAAFQAVGGGTETMDLRLQAPRWLEVVVTAAEGGAPVVGGTVRVAPKDAGGMSVQALMGMGATWLTDADGRVRVGPLPEGVLRLAVTAAGFVTSSDHEVAADAGGVVAIALQRGLVLSGRAVMPAGAPVQNVVLSVSRNSPGGSWFHENPPVAPDGTFRIDTIGEGGTYQLSATARWNDRRFVGATQATAGTTDVEIVLAEEEQPERETVVVNVLDADGKPVPSGRVQIHRFDARGGTSTNSTRLSAGQATFRGLETEGELWIEVYGLVGAARGATLEGPVRIVEGRLDVRLGAPLRIAGRVVGPDGGAVAGVRVTAQAVHPRGGTSRDAAEHGSGVSDVEGRFEIKGLGPLDYTLVSTVPSDFAPPTPEAVHAGQVNVVVNLRQGLRATILAVDYDGKPTSGVRVWYRPKGDAGLERMAMQTLVTDAEGRVVIRGLDASLSYHLQLHPPEGRDDLTAIQLQDWSPADQTFTFARVYSIRGTVVDQHGQPYEGAGVRGRKVGASNWTKWARSDGDGAFEMDGLEMGRYELKTEAPGESRGPQAPGDTAPEPGVVTVRAGATGVKLTIDVGMALEVRLEGLPATGRDPRSGGTTAFLRPAEQGGAFLHGSFQDGSTVRFQGLVAGTTYRLWIGGLPGGRYVLEETVRAQEAPLVVRAVQGGSITGTVRTPPDVKFQGIGVSCHDARGLGVSGQADAEGRFTLSGLPPGTWTVVAQGWPASSPPDGSSGAWRATTTTPTGGVATLELAKP